MLCPGSSNLILTQEDWPQGFEQASVWTYCLKAGVGNSRYGQLQRVVQQGIETVFDDKNEKGHLQSADQVGLDELATAPPDQGTTNMLNDESLTGQPQATDVAAIEELAADSRNPAVAEKDGTTASLAHHSDSVDGLGLEVLVEAAQHTAPTPEEAASISRAYRDQERHNRNSRAQNVNARIAEDARRKRRARIRTSGDNDQCQASGRRTTLLTGGKIVKRPSGSPQGTSIQKSIEYKDELAFERGRALRSGKGSGTVRERASVPKGSDAASLTPQLELAKVKKSRKDNGRITARKTSETRKRKPIKGRRGLDN
ncbi:MAG: hypothetical protein Q9223_002687 [Gallowayella weberi]